MAARFSWLSFIRGPVRLLLLVAVIAALLAVPAFGGKAARQKTPAEEIPASSDQIVRERVTQHRQERDRFEARRRGPEARERRRRSRDRFSDKSDREARRVVASELPELLEAPIDRPLKVGEVVGRYLDDSTAVLNVDPGAPGGKKLHPVVTSSVPLLAEKQGRKRPWSLDLEEHDGSFVPAVPLVDMRIAKRGSAVVELTKSGVSLAPRIASGASADGELTDGKVLFANVQADTDYLVKPLATGVESYFVIRSENSPERFEMALDLPAGTTARRPDPAGPILIDRGGRRAVTIVPPTAWDAEGEAVPMTMALEGGVVSLSVKHRGADYQYPLTADPPVYANMIYWNWSEGTEGDGWTKSQFLTGSADFLMQSGDPDGSGAAYQNGLHVIARPYQAYPYGNTATWTWATPANRDMYAYRVDLTDVDFDTNGGFTGLEGLFSSRRNGWEPYGRYGDTAASTVGGVSPATNVGSFPDANLKFCAASDCNEFAGDEGNDFRIGLYSTSGAATLGTRLHVGRATVYLYDREAPQLTSFSRMPATEDRWSDGESRSFTVSASDTGRVLSSSSYRTGGGGFGVTYYNFFRPSGVERRGRTGALPGVEAGDECKVPNCPVDWTKSVNYAPNATEDGVREFGVIGYDEVGHETEGKTWQVRNDARAPEITQRSGTLADQDHALTGTTFGLRASASDGTGANQPSSNSGVASIAAKVDDLPEQRIANACADLDSCAQSDVDFSFSGLGDGDHTVNLSARDKLWQGLSGDSRASRHAAAQSWSVVVDNDPPQLTGVSHNPPLSSSVPPAWVREYSGTANLAATDAGTGVAKAEIKFPAADGSTTTVTRAGACPGSTPRRCSRSQTVDVAYGASTMAEGANTVRASVLDDLDRRSQEQTWQLRLDRTAPVVTSSLRPSAGSLVPTNLVTVSANDRAGSEDRSGISKLGVEVDGDPAQFIDVQCGTDSCDSAGNVTCSGECPQQVTATVKLDSTRYSLGLHQTRVTSTDKAGNVRRGDEFPVLVLGLNQVDRGQLGLESWFAYESTDTGAGSAAHVNAVNGNLVWHSVPVDNVGRGLDTTINLTYNSQDRGGLIASLIRPGGIPIVGGDLTDLIGTGYGEAGVGVSIGAGVTRLNEPLAGVNVLDAFGSPISSDVTLTDADGTAHTFTRNGSEYVEPAGVNLKLRKLAGSDVTRAWSMTKPDGTTYTFDRLGYQTYITDRNIHTSPADSNPHPNTIRFEYEWYSKVTGKPQDCPQIPSVSPSLQIQRSLLCAPRIRRIVDAAGTDAEPVQPAPGQEGTVAEQRSIKISYRDQPLLSDTTPAAIEAVRTALSTLDPAQILGLATVAGSSGRVSRIVDHASRVTDFSYSDTGYLSSLAEGEVLAHGAVPASTRDRRTFGLSYTDVGSDKLLSSVADPRGSTTVLAYTPGRAAPCNALDRNPRVVSVTDRRGKARRACYGPGSMTTTAPAVEATGSNDTVYTLDATGRPTSIVDRLSRQTTLAWDADNNPATVVKAANTASAATTAFQYNANGQAVSKTDPLGHRTVLDYCYRTLESPTRTCSDDAPGASTSGLYVSDLSRVTRPAGDFVQYGTDPAGNPTSRRYSDESAPARADYDLNGDLISETDEVGNLFTYPESSYDANGLPGRKIDARQNAGEAGYSGTWRYRYDLAGNLESVVDPRGNGTDSSFTTTFYLDAFDRVTDWFTPLNGSTSVARKHEYDANGNLITETDGKGKQTRFAYSATDQLEDSWTPEVIHDQGSAAKPERTHYAYDDRDQLILKDSPNGTETSVAEDWATRFGYDAEGQLTVEKRQQKGQNPLDLTTSYAYDLRGNLEGLADPEHNKTGTPSINAMTAAGQRWKYGYDLADNKTSEIEDPSGLQLTTQYVYDDNDRQTVARSPKWTADKPFSTSLAYNARDQVVSKTQGASRKTTYVRRADGRVSRVIGPRGNREGASANTFATTYAYNRNGELASWSVPSAGLSHEDAGRSMRYTRNAVGDPVTMTDPRGNAIENSFFDSGELRSTTRPSLWTADLAPDGQRAGSPEISEKPYGQWGTGSGGDVPGSPEPEGDFGSVGAESLPGLLPDAGATTFSYDGDMRLNGVMDAAGQQTQISRDDVGRTTAVQRPFIAGGATITTRQFYDFDGNLIRSLDGENHATVVTYDQFDRPLSSSAPGSSASVDAPEAVAPNMTLWGYDRNGNTTSVLAATQKTTTMAYDVVDRMIRRTDPLGFKTTFGYDRNGNRTCMRLPRGNTADSSCPSAASPFATRTDYNEFDEPVSRTRYSDTTANPLSWTFDYDEDGNQIKVSAPGAGRDAVDPPSSGGGGGNGNGGSGSGTVSAGSPVAQVTLRSFDGRGLPYSQTKLIDGTSSGSKRTTVTEYDANRNLRRTVNPAGVTGGGTPAYSDANPDQAPSADSRATSNATVNHYDSDNLLAARYLPWAASDAVEARYQQKFTRDQRGRVTRVQAPHTTAEGPARQASYGYFETGWIACSSRERAISSCPTRADRQSGDVLYEYDKRGLQTGWSVSGRESARTYFPSGLLKSRSAAKAATPNQDDRSYRYGWDPNGNLKQLLDVNQNRRWSVTRDDDDRVTLVNDVTSGAAGRDTRMSYDPDDNVLTRVTEGQAPSVGADGKLSTFTYDGCDRERSLQVTGGRSPSRTTSKTWWPSGQAQSQTKPNGTFESHGYNADGLPRVMRRHRSGMATGSFEKDQVYEYNDNGQRTRDEGGSYGYDSRDRLVRFTDKNANVTNYRLNGSGAVVKQNTGSSWTALIYAGDRLQCTRSYTSDPGSPSSCAASAAAAVGRSDYSYDGLGHVTKITDQDGSSTSYGYDAFGRMIGSQGAGSGAKPVRYVYDGLDRREFKCTDTTGFSGLARPLVDDLSQPSGPSYCRPASSSGYDKTSFGYVGLTEKLSQEQDATKPAGSGGGQGQNGGSSVEQSGEQRGYDYDAGMERLGQDRVPTQSYITPTYRAYVKDARGSVEALEGPYGSLDATYTYDPYGATQQSGNTDTAAKNPFRFEGFYADDGQGSIDMQARPYSPKAGRFLSADEYESAGADFDLEADPLTQDRYAFAGGNPTNNIESDGHVYCGDNASAADCRRRAQAEQKSGKTTPNRGVGIRHLETYDGGPGRRPVPPQGRQVQTTPRNAEQRRVDAAAIRSNYPTDFEHQTRLAVQSVQGRGAERTVSYESISLSSPGVPGGQPQLPQRDETGHPPAWLVTGAQLGWDIFGVDPTDPLSVLGAIVKPVRLIDKIAGAAKGGTKAYRAVSGKELRDIEANGFRVDPSGRGYQTEKLFTTSAEDAARQARYLHGVTGQVSTIVEAEFPSAADLIAARLDSMNVFRVPAENLSRGRLTGGFRNASPNPGP